MDSEAQKRPSREVRAHQCKSSFVTDGKCYGTVLPNIMVNVSFCAGAYTHPYCVRHNRKMCQLITRTKKSSSNKNDAASAPNNSGANAATKLATMPNVRSLTKLESASQDGSAAMRSAMDEKNASHCHAARTRNEQLRAVADNYLEALSQTRAEGSGLSSFGMLPPAEVPGHGRLAPIGLSKRSVQKVTPPPVTLSHDAFLPDPSPQSMDRNNGFAHDSNTALGRFLNESQGSYSSQAGNSAATKTDINQDLGGVFSSNELPLSAIRHSVNGLNLGIVTTDGAVAQQQQKLPTNSGNVDDPRLQQTVQWLLRDVHVSVPELKNVLTMSGQPPESTMHVQQGGNKSMLSHYKQDIIDLFGGSM